MVIKNAIAGYFKSSISFIICFGSIFLCSISSSLSFVSSRCIGFNIILVLFDIFVLSLVVNILFFLETS